MLDSRKIDLLRDVLVRILLIEAHLSSFTDREIEKGEEENASD